MKVEILRLKMLVKKIEWLFYVCFQLGESLNGEIYRILFKCDNNLNGSKEESLILKIAPSNPFRREKFRMRDIYLREIQMYKEVCFHLPFDLLISFQNSVLNEKLLIYNNLSNSRFCRILRIFNYPKEYFPLRMDSMNVQKCIIVSTKSCPNVYF